MKKEICKEYFDKLPFTSKHLFETDGYPHFNPTICIHCGKSAKQWGNKVLEMDKKF